MYSRLNETETTLSNSHFNLTNDTVICQSDYPLDWYQAEFKPYAEEYLSLPDRKAATVIRWMQGYLQPALKILGDELLLVAHYYMGGEIVKLVESFGGYIGDSYQLALMAVNNPEKKLIVESAVHFMAETISVLANADQHTYITNPKAGCTMEMHAKDYMVEPALMDMNERYGQENVLPVCYMNTSGRIKALTGAQGGAVCTSSNVQKIFSWAIEQNKKILFIPDKHMGENVASWLNIPSHQLAYWPSGTEGANYSLCAQNYSVLKQFDNAKIVLFASHCAVHSYYQPDMVNYWKAKDYHVVAHPECPKIVVDVADSWGSTAFIWDQVLHDRANTQKYAIATENHMVSNVKLAAKAKGIEVVNVGDANLQNAKNIGCGCATMSRNDPPHLVGLIDLLANGQAPEYNLVKPGDVVNEFTGTRKRLDAKGQAWISDNAKRALEKMISITES